MIRSRSFFRIDNRLIAAIVLLVLAVVGSQHSCAQESQVRVIERDYSRKLSYRCLVTTPAGYDADPQRKWPLVLFLHGGGAPKPENQKRSIDWLTDLPAIIVAPICPPSPDGSRYMNWDWRILGDVVREISGKYRVDPQTRSVIGFSMGGSGAWELPSYEPKLFSKSVVIAGVCHPWSLRHYPKIPVWVFVGTKDYMRKEQQETVTSAAIRRRRCGDYVD